MRCVVRRRTLALLALPLLLAATAARAGSLFAPGQPASIIDRDLIERYHLPSVARAIETLAGIDVLRTYFKQNVVVARGILEEHYANKILLMIDGVPVWNAVTGEPILDRIRIEDVERIEVTKGPASIEYGTNAFAAAINVVLRHDAPGVWAAHLGLGTEGTNDAGAHATLGVGGLELFVAANHRGDDGERRRFTDESGRLASYREYQRGDDVTMTLRRGRQTLLLNAAWETESFLGNTPALASGLGSDHRSRGLLAAYGIDATLGAVTLRYDAAYDDGSRDFARTGDGRLRSNVEGRRLTNRLTGRWSASALTLDGGLENEWRRSDHYTNYDTGSGAVVDDNNLRGRSSDDWSLFGRARYAWANWSAMGGVRAVHSDLVRSNVSGEGRIDYALDPGNRFALTAGQSYREPSFFELYFQPSSNTVYGNTSLEPETSTAYQLIYTHDRSPLAWKATLYHARYRNKIFRTRRSPADASLIYVNGTPFSANGLELEGRYTAGARSLFASYAFVDGTRGDALPGTDHYNFRYVPQHSVSVGASQTLGAWSLAGAGTWASPTDGPIERVGARWSLDLDGGFTQTLGRLRLRHLLIVSNAFDSEDEIPEFVRRNLNAVPSGIGRRIAYRLELTGR